MIRRILFIATVLICLLTESSPQRVLKTFTLEELQTNFYPDRMRFNWVSGTEYAVTDIEGLKKYNAETGTVERLINFADLINLDPLSDYRIASFSNDQKYFLLLSKLQRLYRRSNLADYHIYSRDKKSLTTLGLSLQEVLWSSRNAIAYVKDNNVYYVPDVANPNSTIALTTEGKPGEMYYGITDWIYEEEVFNNPQAMWFSPNGTYLAIASFNDTKVESIEYPVFGAPDDPKNQYPEIVRFKYPKAGRTNPEVGLRIFKLDNFEDDAKAFDVPAPIEIVGKDYILGRVNWATDENVVVLWLNRRQNISVLINCNLLENKCLVQREHKELQGWINIEHVFFNKSGTELIEIQPLTYKNRRFMHVARFDFDTLNTVDLSPVNGTVVDVVGWNLNTDTVYYTLSPETEPWQRQLWLTSQGTTKCISCQISRCSFVESTFSTDASYAVIGCSAVNIPHVFYLYESKTNKYKPIVTNSKLANKLESYKLPMVLFNRIPLEEGVISHVKLLLPPEMELGKKYPMVVRVYAGPGSTRVKDLYDVQDYYSTYLSSNRSFIVASIDVRGSGAMGVEALHAVNNALGTVELTDTLAAIRKLVTTYDFIDPKRVAIWGWSYGGFASTMILIKDDQHTLACAAAVAPVTSWLYYDTIYTERYMDTPQANPKGYARADILPVATKIRDRRYLLIHGTGDDNVHYQNSLQLAKVLQENDIDFEQVSYTDENHSLGSVSRHLYHKLDHFWTDCFRL